VWAYINNKTLSITGGKRRANSSRKSLVTLVYLTLSKALVASSILQNTRLWWVTYYNIVSFKIIEHILVDLLALNPNCTGSSDVARKSL